MDEYINVLESTYDECLISGCVTEKKDTDLEAVKSLKEKADTILDSIKEKDKTINKDNADWTLLFKENYDALRLLIDAYLHFDKIIVENDLCKFACICTRNPNFDLNWDFLEHIRLKRDAVDNSGLMMNHNDRRALKLEFELHIHKLREEIGKNLKI
jgi:hypothetical protein